MGSVPKLNEQATFFTTGDKHEFDPDKWTTAASNGSNGGQHDESLPLPKREADTNVRVLIVGAGIGGLMSALECWRKGHTVVGILERNEAPNYSGDLIIIQPSALEVMRHWPQMSRELEQDKVTAGTYYYRHNGELIDGPSTPNFNAPEYVSEREQRHGGFPHVGAVQIRKKFYRMLLRQVARLGFTVEYGQRVEGYFEVDTAGLAGVVVAGGPIRTAHVGKRTSNMKAAPSDSTLI
jgi:2-polyprenyl-6-methoxyphenol hydroxylase-like FAD-dependent oxidoreductase